MQQDYDQVFTNLKVLEAQIKQIKVTIDKTAIRAPFNGRIGIVNIYRGALVSPGTALTTIEDNSQVKVDFSIPEKYTSTVNIGDAIGFTVESTAKPYQAKVIAREASVDNTTRSLLVRAVSDNPNKELLPGQSARLKVRLNSSANAIMIPNQALIPSSQGYSVFVSQGGKAIIKPVEIGQRDAYSVHITKGLKAGDTLIVSNMLRLAPGSQVQLVSIK
ncbi:Multidrug efflux pump subunit AcrA precursor [compost metagenome]